MLLFSVGVPDEHKGRPVERVLVAAAAGGQRRLFPLRDARDPDVRLLRPREAADVLALSVRQLDRLVEAGVVQPVRLVPNGNRRFRLRDLPALSEREDER